jgi:glycosyltransferase involved in cell wall biosynthesis
VDKGMLALFEEVATIHFKYSKRLLQLHNIRYLRLIKKKVNPTIIHSHLLEANWLTRLSFPLHKNLFNSIHSPYSKDAFSHHVYTKWIEKFTFYISKAHLIFVSPIVQDDYIAHINVGGRGAVLMNFVEDKYFMKKALNYAPGTNLHFVCVGNVKKIKNYDLLIKVFENIKQYPIFLDVYGAGDNLKGYCQLVEKKNLKINFKGSVNNIDEILPNYHAFLFPSFYEGFSIALLEAMAARLPLVLSDIPMFKMLTRGRALFFDPQSKEECKQAILMSFKNGFDQTLIEENFNYVNSHFNSDIFKKNLATIYNQKLEFKLFEYGSVDKNYN